VVGRGAQEGATAAAGVEHGLAGAEAGALDGEFVRRGSSLRSSKLRFIVIRYGT
jgi:hypothetical protein